MTIFWVIILGIIQGLTEFLPVSSSGHLVLAQHFIPGFSQPGVLFDVVLHFGTLFSVLIFFRKKIFHIDFSYLTLLIIGSIPAALFGLLFRTTLENSFTQVGAILGIQFFITSVLCFWIDKLAGTKKTISAGDSFIIGIGQALAIVPAISRSGATIFAALKRGIARQEALQFSFLLSVPAILGANALELYHARNELSTNSSSLILGFIASAVFGYMSISWTMQLLKNSKFKIFGFYAALLGILTFFL